MARRYTRNTVATLDEVEALFDGLRPGVAKRIRCAVCEADERLTHASALRWFLEHNCGATPEPNCFPALKQISARATSPLRRCPCCSSWLSQELIEIHLDAFMRGNGIVHLQPHQLARAAA